MSNFAATAVPFSGRISPTDKASSKIIDAFSNGNYVFVDVSVEFRIYNALRFLRLGMDPLSALRRFFEPSCTKWLAATRIPAGSLSRGAPFLALVGKWGSGNV